MFSGDEWMLKLLDSPDTINMVGNDYWLGVEDRWMDDNDDSKTIQPLSFVDE